MRKPPRVTRVTWLPKNSVETMIADHFAHAPEETGGVLMGYWASPNEAVVMEVTSAGRNARHSKDGYEPDVAHDLREIARIYEKSGRLNTYLGDWHTHPDSSPVLSRRDRRTLAAIAADGGARARQPMMVIIAEADRKFEIVTWCLQAEARTPRSMKIQLFDPAEGGHRRA